MSDRQHFICKLTPPRPTFFSDQSPQEQAVMARHVAYWTELFDRGVAVVFSPVLDPAGVWGLAIVEAENEAAVKTIVDNDPVVLADLGTIEVHPMPGAVVRPPAAMA